MNPEILLETKDFIVINKPSGLIVHNDGKHDEPSIVDWFLSKYPEAKDVGEPITETSFGEIDRSGVIHRLDKETSGAMILVKNQKAYEFFKKQFQDRTIKKEYVGIVFGRFREKKGKIDLPIGRSKTGIRKWATGRGARGDKREAITLYEVIEDFTHLGQVFSVMKFFPLTGRTHQIRVHMLSKSHPLVGDSLYAGDKKVGIGLKRLALHAYRLTFSDLEGNSRTIVAPMPPDIALFIKL